MQIEQGGGEADGRAAADLHADRQAAAAGGWPQGPATGPVATHGECEPLGHRNGEHAAFADACLLPHLCRCKTSLVGLFQCTLHTSWGVSFQQGCYVASFVALRVHCALDMLLCMREGSVLLTRHLWQVACHFCLSLLVDHSVGHLGTCS